MHQPTTTRQAPVALPWRYHDGGRTAAGYTGQTGDCVVRALAIATGLPYRDVYDQLAAGQAARGKARSCRNGVGRKVYEAFLFDHGWLWLPTMRVGSGCTTHLAAGEVPMEGPVVVRLSRHLATVIDGVVYDHGDPGRGGTRCVYGWYEPGAGATARWKAPPAMSTPEWAL